MRHVSPEDLVRLVSGQLPDAERLEAETHLRGCEGCRRSRDNIAAVHALLGEWKVDAQARDLWPAVERGLDAGGPAILHPRWAPASRLLRIAAAVVIAVGLGHAIGRLTSSPAAPVSVASLEGAEVQAADELGLHVMEWPSAAGLFPTVLDLSNAPASGEARP